MIRRSRRAAGPGAVVACTSRSASSEVEELRHRSPQRMLQTKSIEHVALGAAATPGVFKQSAHVAEILREAAFGRNRTAARPPANANNLRA